MLRIGAAYVRVSDERQDEYSPDSQLKKIKEYAAKEGCLIPEEYVFYDDGISGKSAKRRDSFNRMIALAKDKSHPFDVIYVWKFSRFARNQEESMVYKNLLRKKGVSVVSVSEPIPEGHYGTLIERIIEWMDEFYLINLGAEVTRGMTEKVSRGEPTGPPPYGYIMKDKKYYPDEESGAADIVREVFRRYADGEKQRAIAVSLGNRGIRTKYGNMPENRWIDYMLHNPCYIG
ncbi:MAG: recombinase family protein, partial [Candidatus Avispirillum sp.]